MSRNDLLGIPVSYRLVLDESKRDLLATVNWANAFRLVESVPHASSESPKHSFELLDGDLEAFQREKERVQELRIELEQTRQELALAHAEIAARAAATSPTPSQPPAPEQSATTGTELQGQQ
jgi:hypothetical protein